MHIIITGTSSGIGKAIADHYLEQGFAVTGIGRRHTIAHPSYTPITCDFSDSNAVAALVLPVVNDATLLINNAGMLGHVQRLRDQQQPDIQTVLQVNVVAPALLMNRYAQLCGDAFPLTVVNISSGAAKRVIPSWSAYCASKAALELLSATFYAEEQEKGRSTKVYAVAPGVVDTKMQGQIRTVDPKDFSASTTFHNYHEQAELADPVIVAKKLARLLDQPYDGAVSYSLRDISL